MTWNYRVIRSKDDAGVSYSIHECYYKAPGDAIPTSWTVNPVAVSSETRGGLSWVLSGMREALAQPVLEARGDRLVKVEGTKQ
jgi:hypothetical protein